MLPQIYVTFYNITQGEYKETVGPFESLQVTGLLMRDQDDRVVANYYDEIWVSHKSGNGWYDFVIGVKNGKT